MILKIYNRKNALNLQKFVRILPKKLSEFCQKKIRILTKKIRFIKTVRIFLSESCNILLQYLIVTIPLNAEKMAKSAKKLS
jgi:hypothetical protein